jgi:cysteine synthase A
MPLHDCILDTIGHTPVVRLNKLAPAGVRVYVKLESFNPLGSVKDRMARAVIEHAERTGALRPGQTVVEATSGNTGIGLAMVCAQKGYPLVVVMAESFSVERRKLLRFMGARVVLTPAAEKGSGMLNKAAELAREHGWFLCRQFENEANAEVHTRTTAQEILADFHDEPLHAFVSGFGTGGTLLGVARGLKASGRGIRIIAAEPDNSPMLGSRLPQPRDAAGQPSESHPHFRPHLMQGWSPDFVSKLTETAVAEELIDEIVPVAGQDALDLTRSLARQEGIFVGTSSGATLAAALTVARRSPAGANILCLLPDTGERYLSTPLFEHIIEDMDDAELAISRSSPGYRFDVPTAALAAPAAPVAAAVHAPMHAPAHAPVHAQKPALDAAAAAFVTDIVRDRPVVMFALEWCEFCWSARKLFARLGVSFESVDVDAVRFQPDDLGVKIRAVLKERTGSPTMPQIYIGGRHVGGCMDLFDAMRTGTLQPLLEAAGVAFDGSAQVDTSSLLPRWIHPRKAA